MSNFNTPKWDPIVEPGYVYISVDEYYLYVDKVVEEGLAAGAGGVFTLPGQKWLAKYPVPAPVVVTDYIEGSGLTGPIASGTPFAKTYEPPLGDDNIERTPRRYRRRYDLTGFKDQILTPTGHIPYVFTLEDHEYSMTYTGPDSSGFYTAVLAINPSGARIVVEYENPFATGLFKVPDLDMNPVHSANVGNKFIVVTDLDPSGEVLIIERRDTANLPGAEDIVYFDLYLETEFGAPVQNVPVYFQASPTGLSGFTFGLIEPSGGAVSETITQWDGSATGAYFLPADLTLFPSSGVVITAWHAEATGTIAIEVGMER